MLWISCVACKNNLSLSQYCEQIFGHDMNEWTYGQKLLDSQVSKQKSQDQTTKKDLLIGNKLIEIDIKETWK